MAISTRLQRLRKARQEEQEWQSVEDALRNKSAQEQIELLNQKFQAYLSKLEQPLFTSKYTQDEIQLRILLLLDKINKRLINLTVNTPELEKHFEISNTINSAISACREIQKFDFSLLWKTGLILLFGFTLFIATMKFLGTTYPVGSTSLVMLEIVGTMGATWCQGFSEWRNQEISQFKLNDALTSLRLYKVNEHTVTNINSPRRNSLTLTSTEYILQQARRKEINRIKENVRTSGSEACCICQDDVYNQETKQNNDAIHTLNITSETPFFSGPYHKACLNSWDNLHNKDPKSNCPPESEYKNGERHFKYYHLKM